VSNGGHGPGVPSHRARIEDRAVVVNGEIVVRPMMYIALSYDHRLIDGREAVTALKIMKEAIEDPTRMLIDL
jgi:2-oxoglutarate dehydrogenase E2 component (dihydrolipoamide succinyltransferase)